MPRARFHPPGVVVPSARATPSCPRVLSLSCFLLLLSSRRARGVSTPAHLVQTGKIIVEERKKKFSLSRCGAHTRRCACPGFSVVALCAHLSAVMRFSFLLLLLLVLVLRARTKFIGRIARVRGLCYPPNAHRKSLNSPQGCDRTRDVRSVHSSKNALLEINSI